MDMEKVRKTESFVKELTELLREVSARSCQMHNVVHAYIDAKSQGADRAQAVLEDLMMSEADQQANLDIQVRTYLAKMRAL